MTYSTDEQDMLNVLEKHIAAEMQGDMATTMSTMNANPHLLNVPNTVSYTHLTLPTILRV